jgi:uncharacterized membrane protein
MGSTIVIVTFDDMEKAGDLLKSVEKMENENYVVLKDAAVVVKDDKGKVKVKETDEPSTAKGAAVGGSLGLVIGIVLGGPVGGLLLGGALGAWAARKTDLGIDNEKIKSVEEGMPNGSSALFMQIQEAAKKEWLIALIRDSGGNVVELALDDTAEVEIEEQMAGYSSRQ